jgi:hypothetical protein
MNCNSIFFIQTDFVRVFWIKLGTLLFRSQLHLQPKKADWQEFLIKLGMPSSSNCNSIFNHKTDLPHLAEIPTLSNHIVNSMKPILQNKHLLHTHLCHYHWYLQLVVASSTCLHKTRDSFLLLDKISEAKMPENKQREDNTNKSSGCFLHPLLVPFLMLFVAVCAQISGSSFSTKSSIYLLCVVSLRAGEFFFLSSAWCSPDCSIISPFLPLSPDTDKLLNFKQKN